MARFFAIQSRRIQQHQAPAIADRRMAIWINVLLLAATRLAAPLF